jgi:hypothetical protein
MVASIGKTECTAFCRFWQEKVGKLPYTLNDADPVVLLFLFPHKATRIG